MKHTFHLVRHGQKEHKIGDPPLTELGKNQAEKTAKHFAQHKKIGKILTSPMLRTKQTALIIASPLNVLVTETELLIERANWGDNPQQSFEEFLAMWAYASVNRDWQPPVGDSAQVAGTRLLEVIEKSPKDSHELVLVTHGGIIGDFLRNVFSFEELDKHLPGFSSHDADISECSITTIQYEDGKFELVEIASTRHLKEE